MSAKKTKKVKKTAAPKSIGSSVKQLEKDFLQMPNQLATAINKDLAVLKQKQAKLTSAVKKLNAQAKKRPLSATNAKKLATLNKEWDANTRIIAALNDQKAKIVALKQHLKQFQQTWAKKAKTQAAPKPKAKKVAQKKKTSVAPTALQPKAPAFEPELIQVTEQAELTT